jgi:hypothetical protein
VVVSIFMEMELSSRIKIVLMDGPCIFHFYLGQFSKNRRLGAKCLCVMQGQKRISFIYFFKLSLFKTSLERSERR